MGLEAGWSQAYEGHPRTVQTTPTLPIWIVFAKLAKFAGFPPTVIMPPHPHIVKELIEVDKNFQVATVNTNGKRCCFSGEQCFDSVEKCRVYHGKGGKE